MESQVKEGKVYVQHRRFGKKWKWKKVWSVLYQASHNGVARLELLDCSGTEERPSSWRPDRKVLRLSECVSVRAVPAEPCPGEGMSAFTVETGSKTFTFAALEQDRADWVEKLCMVAFQGVSGQDVSVQQPVKMAENLIYSSRAEVSEFWVSIWPTDASDRCGLSGVYWLRMAEHSLILLQPETKETLLCWPYSFLRRYGSDKDMFTIEAGRRCPSGPGTFSFETRESSVVFALMQERIREEARGSGCLGDDTAEVEDEGEDEALKCPSLPESRPRSPLPPTPRSAALLEQGSLYAEPADCLRLHGDHSEPVYSDIYDPAMQAVAQRAGSLVLEDLESGTAGRNSWFMPSESLKKEQSDRLYSQVCKRAPTSSSLSISDVIYDNLGNV